MLRSLDTILRMLGGEWGLAEVFQEGKPRRQSGVAPLSGRRVFKKQESGEGKQSNSELRSEERFLRWRQSGGRKDFAFQLFCRCWETTNP